jgi:uncharacterized Ntn-hydrolase superfamily protein
MTYSIIARCSRTNRLGVASATFSIACGRRNESIRAGIGISKSQAFYLRQVDVTALNMLGQGFSPVHIVESLGRTDPDIDYRQFGVVDRDGRFAVHTGPSTKPWSGHHLGDDFACYGNVLRGRPTIDGIAAGFLSDPEAPLEDRLLAAIEGGQAAGGQFLDGEPLPERSAWLCVAGSRIEIDLRVDLHGDAVRELRRIFEEYRRYAGYYAKRELQPKEAPLEEEFVASISSARN